MRVELTPEHRAQLIAEIRTYLLEHHEDDVGDLKAGFLLDFFMGRLGPAVYNRAIRDAQAYFGEKVEALDGEFYEPEPGSRGSV